MITHIGILTLVDSATDEDRRAIAAGLLGLVGQINGLLRAQIGQDLGLKADNCDIIFFLTFESEGAWRNYSAHPAHQAVISERIVPVLVSKSFLQIGEFEAIEP